MNEIAVFWFRRDLRLEDNAGLFYALQSGFPVLPVFIFDKAIFEKLSDCKDKRVQFIHNQIGNLKLELRSLGSDMLVLFDKPLEAWKKIIKEYNVRTVYTNTDYEPYATERDAEISSFLRENGTSFHTFKDQCIFEKDEVLKEDGTPYTVFTPYSKKWKQKLTPFFLSSYPNNKYFNSFLKIEKELHFPSISEIGFSSIAFNYPDKQVALRIIKEYADKRDFPGINGTSKLGLHFRFGTISIREKARKAIGISEIFLNELIWRDFYMQILYHFPYVVKHSFKKQYDKINWLNNELDFEKWCNGKTGYPIVDAGMRELNATGYMHNRVRMITASFLTKHLLVDWRLGEAYFASKLLDFDLSANNGGWQWAAGCGVDAAPYFRIFNPTTQTDKFDKNFVYIKKWVDEFQTPDYVLPIIEHGLARTRCLQAYREALSENIPQS